MSVVIHNRMTCKLKCLEIRAILEKKVYSSQSVYEFGTAKWEFHGLFFSQGLFLSISTP